MAMKKTTTKKVRLKEIAQDRKDYESAAKVKSSNRRWTSHKKVKKQLGL